MGKAYITGEGGPSLTGRNPNNPSPTGVSDASVGPIFCDDASVSFGFTAYWTHPSATVDPACKIVELTVQKVDGSGIPDPVHPDGTERVVASSETPGQAFEVHISSLALPYKDDSYSHYFLRLHSVGYNGVTVLEESAWSALDHLDLYPDHTVIPPLPSSVIAIERANSRVLDLATMLSLWGLSVTVTLPSDPYVGEWVRIELVDSSGVPQYVADRPITTNPQTYTDVGCSDLQRIIPSAAVTYKVRVNTGVPMATNARSEYTESAGFSVAGIGSPSATGVTGAGVGSQRNSPPTADGVAFYGYDITLTTPTTDPYFKYAKVTLKHANSGGAFDPTYGEHEVVQFGTPGVTRTAVSGVNWPAPSASEPYPILYYQCYDVNSLGVAVLQTTCWGGADHATATPTAPAGALEGARLKALSVGTAAIDNLAVTEAKIANLAVTDAKIGSLSVSKLLAGTVDVAVLLTAATIDVISGTVRIQLDGTNFLKVTDSGTPTSYSQVTAVGVTCGSTVNSAFASIGTTGPYNTLGVLALQDHNGVKLLIRSAVASTASAGSATLPASPQGFLDAYWNSVAIRIPYYLA